MRAETYIDIDASKEDVWTAITDFENCENLISAIIHLEILDKPEGSLIGFKWRETRKMFGKESTETMWITDCVANSYYTTRAESHGCIYTSSLSLESTEAGSRLHMKFYGESQSLISKIMSALMGPLMTGSLTKAMHQDLVDIKKYIENKAL